MRPRSSLARTYRSTADNICPSSGQGPLVSLPKTGTSANGPLLHKFDRGPAHFLDSKYPITLRWHRLFWALSLWFDLLSGLFLVPRCVFFLPFLRTENGQKKTPVELPTGVNLYQRKTFR